MFMQAIFPQRCVKYFSGVLHKYPSVVAAVFLSYSISAEGVVVESWVLHQRNPFLPARGYIRAIVLIQIFSKKG